LNELTIVSVWPLLLPVRGRLETILIVVPAGNWAAAAGAALGDATAAGAAEGEAAGLATGLAAGDDAVVVAESLGQLAPLELRDARSAELEADREATGAPERAGA